MGNVRKTLKWVAERMDINFVDTNSWLADDDCVPLNRTGSSYLGKHFSRVVAIGKGRND